MLLIAFALFAALGLLVLARAWQSSKACSTARAAAMSSPACPTSPCMTSAADGEPWADVPHEDLARK